MPDPQNPSVDSLIPGFTEPTTWASMRTLMQRLAWSPRAQRMVDFLIEGLRRESPFLTPELIRRELAMIFAALVDPSFPGEGPTMT